MIKNFRHKGLKQLYETGSHQGVRPEHVKRLRLILARLDASQKPNDMRLPGLKLHSLKGDYEGFWAVSVSGNWRVVFRFEDNSAADIDYLDYQLRNSKMAMHNPPHPGKVVGALCIKDLRLSVVLRYLC